MAPSKITSKEQVHELLNNYDTFVFDCDGVIWLGDHKIPGAVESIELLKKLGKQVIFVTNNSTKSRQAYTKKFEKFGLNISKEEIFGSAYASATYLQEFLKLPKDEKVWVLGESGIQEELKELGYESIGGTDVRLNEKFDSNTTPFLPKDPKVGAVIAGLDPNINYHRLAITLQYLQDPNVKFLATNIDSTFPQKGLILPGAGSIIESVSYSSGRTPIACGKPSQNMLDAIVADKKLDRSRTIMIGDRLNTDIKFGNDGGLGTLLVLTGIETEENVLKTGAPKYYADGLGVIGELY
ncbi:Phosphoglycolate phosphatase [Wickerhamomyces ciferrii]|uniref:4-nitrophenylphosphatase n=1 Tax=Wickerhamomyces ciferrii (strain ATCC 14091 / BCRC 22168 / CBS 111 / JCM 3599 / NBRC 0793 / NRRL Y-1031 F-60-10) TaxID=1206466 RepID=K0KA73_WICCF|nr:Phosphoglycolate phosphatase [Wickerhamomyces ciferrii]CCH41830.1 Phosphoglycolate phosphatase [Wickerhamomyces ciferrii]